MRFILTILLALLLPFAADAQGQKKKTSVRPATTTKAKTTARKPAAKPAAKTQQKKTTKSAAKSQTKPATKQQYAPQNESREVRQLRGEKEGVQKQIQENEKQLSATKKSVTTKQQQVAYIERQLKERVSYINRLSTRIDSIDRATRQLEAELKEAAARLAQKKERYAESLRYARTQRTMGGTFYFILSANTWQQMYRRARYAREYAVWQQSMGREIMAQQAVMMDKQSKLLAYRSEMRELLDEISRQRAMLMGEHREQQKVLGGLKEKQRGLAAEIEKQRKRVAELDKKIDQVIAREIEAARKRAEEAERKRRAAEEAERRRLAAEGKAPSRASSTSSSSSSSASSGAFITTADRQLSGSFELNKGKLPVPITGPYRIGGRMGRYSVEGTHGVQLNNNGTDYVGRTGACARAVFDGEVTSIFAYTGMTNVIVRHGSYMTVYCNLSSVRVHMGQRVKTGDLLGAIAPDDRGEPTLHFQLRKEKAKLNPEQWIAR